MFANRLTRFARRAVPRGSALWYPYFYAKRWLSSGANLEESRPVLFYVVHNNILLESRKAIYFYIPKVACSSIKLLCAQVLGLKADFGDKDAVEEIHLLDFPCVAKYRVKKDYADYFRFCFVRNPWDRLVSCYKDKINYHQGHVYERYENSFIKFLKQQKMFKSNMTFEDFVNAVCNIPDDIAEGHLRSQHTFIIDEGGNQVVNFIGRFENLEEDLRIVREKLGTNHDVPHLRKTTHKAYTAYYTEDCATRVFERYKKDIEQFAYQFGS